MGIKVRNAEPTQVALPILGSPNGRISIHDMNSKSFTLLWSAVFLSLNLAACRSKPQVIEIDHRFSYNVAKVPAWFPDEKYVPTPAEQEVLDRLGKPDFVHFWWRADGDFITSSDLAGKNLDIADVMKETKRTWIYMHDKSEIEFHKTGSAYDRNPLTPQLQLICTYGDPTRRSPPKTNTAGQKLETWEWIEHGIRIDFVDGQEKRREHFAGTGRGTYIMK